MGYALEAARSPRKMSGNGIHVGVIGVGTAGVSAIRWCVQRGLSVRGFEREDGCGGIWKWGSTHSPAYDSLYTNSSGMMMGLGDSSALFPSRFPNHKETCAYYNDYMDEHNLKKFVFWNTLVERVYKEGNRWAVEYRTVSQEPNPQPKIDFFDRIIIATGRLWDPSLPDWLRPLFSTPNKLTRAPSHVSANQIEILHSRDYRNPKRFKGKRVMVVGVGNSALDISLELARDPNVQKPVLVSCRRGTVVMPIDDINGFPVDPYVTSRAFQYIITNRARNALMTRNVDQVNRELRALGLPPPPKPNDYFAVENPVSNLKESYEYVRAVRSGLIQFVEGVVGFGQTPKSFQTAKEKDIEGVDAAIFCTGYRVGIDFLDPAVRNQAIKTVVQSNGNKVEYADLYKNMLFASDPTIAFLVLVTSFGNESVIGSMQARWLSRFWADHEFAGRVFSLVNFKKESEGRRKFIVKSCTTNPFFVRKYHITNYAI